MWSLKDHGKDFDAVFNREHPPGFRWLHESFGGNGRMLELQAAIGRIQLARMPEWSAARRRHAERIWNTARGIKALRVAPIPDWATHASYKAYVFVEPDELKAGWSRDRILVEVNGRGVPCFSGSCSEIYLEKAFEGTGWRPAQRFPVARELGETSLMFLVHPTLIAEQLDKTCHVLEEVMRQAAR
jgi:dTDP-4-amino-4,6-dideoxygalactose transaminase